jgi:hypothetical protein
VTLRRLPDSPIGYAGTGIWVVPNRDRRLEKISRSRGRVPSPLKVEARLWPGKIQQDHVRALLHALEDNFTPVWGEVEVANVEVGREVG